MPVKKSKNTLNRTETLYRKLIENMNEAVWMGDKDERTIYANPKFCELMEYSMEEMMGKKSYEFWDEESAKKVREVNMTKRKQGISSSYEVSLLTKTGKKIPVLLNGTPLSGGGTIGIMTDLSELKKKESLYKKLIDNMNEAVWMGDKDERTIYANPKFCELTGYPLEDMIGKESYFFWDEESAARVREVNRTKRRKGLSSSYEGNLLTKMGEKVPVIVSGSTLSDGGTIGILTDLSELKEKEKTERILNSAIRYANDAIIIFNPFGEVTSWNKGAKMIFGYKKEEMVGELLDKIFDQDEIEEILVHSKIQYNVELQGLHKNNNPLIISATFTPIFDENKEKSAFYLLIARDITSQSKFEEALTLKYEKMKEAYNRFGIIRRQMDYLFEILDLTRNEQNQKTMADYIVSSIIMLTGVDACVLRVYDPSKNMLNLLSSFGVGKDWRGKASIRYKNSLVEKAFQKKAPLKIIDVAKRPKYQSKYLAKNNNFSSLLLIPLQFKGKLVGSLSLYAKSDKKLAIFENEFIEKYAKLIELVVGTMEC